MTYKKGTVKMVVRSIDLSVPQPCWKCPWCGSSRKLQGNLFGAGKSRRILCRNCHMMLGTEEWPHQTQWTVVFPAQKYTRLQRLWVT